MIPSCTSLKVVNQQLATVSRRCLSQKLTASEGSNQQIAMIFGDPQTHHLHPSAKNANGASLTSIIPLQRNIAQASHAVDLHKLSGRKA